MSTMSADFRYKALASDMRDFYPPERLWPISPNLVLSPLGKAEKSSSRQQAQITFAYQSASFSRPNRMLD